MRSYSITMKSTKIGIPLIIMKPSTGGGVFCYILQHNENETWFEGYVDDRSSSLPPVNGYTHNGGWLVYNFLWSGGGIICALQTHFIFLKITPNKTTLSIIIKCGGIHLLLF
jgi:hypothetical protein